MKCSIVIFDDFNNVLVAQRGKGKNVIKNWGLFGKEVKETGNLEKNICKVVDKDLKCTIFDLKPFSEIKIDEEESTNFVFTGSVKEYITTHRSINEVKWIGKRDIEKYNFSDEDKIILEKFFNSI